MTIIEQLKEGFTKPLPGRKAQNQMAHAVRQHVLPIPDDVYHACVLILLYPKNKDWHIVFIERMSNNNPNDRHRGQMGFPGGRVEPEDGSLEITALREAHEEVGVDPEQVKILGATTELHIPVSNFLVHPFVGYTLETPVFVPQPEEVKSIVEAPLSLLLDPSTRQQTHIKLSTHMTLKDVPFFNVSGHIIWGATAMMLSEFLSILGKVPSS